jgi:uncharacterized protein YjbI with pentapeptide repeats
LSEADLREADLREANLIGANLRGAKIDDTTRIDDRWRRVWEIVNQGAVERNMRQANLRGADLIKVDLEGADLRGANLEGADLSGANLSGANLSLAHLSGANLRGARLRGADLSYTLYHFGRGATLSGADLGAADLAEADLSGVDLRRVDHLHEANLEGARYNSDTIWPDGFDPGDAGAVKVLLSEGAQTGLIVGLVGLGLLYIGIRSNYKDNLVIGGFLASYLAWVTGLLVVSYMAAGGFFRILDFAFGLGYFGIICTLPGLAIGLIVLWVVVRDYIAKKANQSRLILITAIIISLIITSVCGSLGAMFAIAEVSCC